MSKKMICSICGNHQATFLFCEDQWVNDHNGKLQLTRGKFYGLCRFCEDRVKSFIMEMKTSKTLLTHQRLLESIKDEFTNAEKAYAIIEHQLEHSQYANEDLKL
jgi:hypothetical protein